MTTAPWAPGSAVSQVNGVPVLDDVSTLLCTWGGVIRVNHPAQSAVQST